jgi:UDP-glucose 4-epimerase
LRFGNLWGDGQSEHLAEPNVLAAFRSQIKEHGHVKVEGGGYQTRDFVHIADAAVAMANAVESPHWAVADICTGVQTSILSIAEQFGVPIMQVPGRENDPLTVVQDPSEAIRLWGWTAKRRGVRL